MIFRSLTLVSGLVGALGLSQFPAYSQQYTQRLGGAVDELARVVDDFDASATAAGLSREAALDQMAGSAFLEYRRADMARTFERHGRLSADLDALRAAGPFMRAYHAARLTDTQIAARAWHDYRPALPLDFAGLVFALAGFVTVGGAFSAFLSLLRGALRRHRHSRGLSRIG
ncbi:DUF2937 family protein [Lutimaribacter sp. EGI FJ00015]|uniref:DUF2937 family protein n=1 Tax=Lutimaribacter degradans TaxID=2945989 RepID=A0ACC6A242_9RHOB|nr:DUF2937 family protein [Lutimaribacter sp. EGI FJ00013]MCM2563829.1 DUF2937 family protein [Lutimaribacter sp. EGI FJ00013]MCO0615016.1 DUF2937 family protein [Lutimaribacter sp. EGI FJ00015]MCO0637680.1 DUF2937 family protein [Lutimaribacter sp. EGI FJ00014]